MLATSSFFRVKEGNSAVELQVEVHLFLSTHIHRISFFFNFSMADFALLQISMMYV